MPRSKSPGVVHGIWRVRFYASMIADAIRTGHYGLAVRLGRELRSAERALKMAVVLLVPLSILGCATPTAKDVSRAVGRPVTVEYQRGAGGWETRDGAVIVRLEPGWTWEPTIYHWGAVAGMACGATGADPDKVADELGIPRFAMWDGSAETSKVEATKQQARLERYLPHTYTLQDSAPGWPTQIYR